MAMLRRLCFLLVVVGTGCTRANNEIGSKDFQVLVDELTKLSNELRLPEDGSLNISELLNKYGYPLEYHDAETEDGWTLTMHRIPYGKQQINEPNATKPVIFFGHPLTGCSMNWVFRVNVSLALQLADEGYDVWLGNTRANMNSLKHKTLTPKDAEFWNFSFHEKGYYDTAAMIDYVQTYTKVDKMTYVGYSQGTAQFLALAAARPEYNDKFNLVTLLSPIAFMSHVTRSPVAALAAPFVDVLQELGKLLNFYGFYKTNSVIFDLFNLMCCQTGVLQDICLTAGQLMVGFDKNVDKDLVSLMMMTGFGGVATKELFHYLQEINSGHFRQYDYGNVTNLEIYGSIEPPSYDVSKITVPLAIYYGKSDFLGTVEDIEYLKTQLTNANIVDDYLVDYDGFNHFDFIAAFDLQEILYDRVIEVINKANKK